MSAGIITTVAGGWNGDGGPAVDAALSDPRAVAVAPDGSLFICDGDVLRRVDLDGIITTFAGSGVSGYAGDGGAASSASLSRPEGLAIADDGAVYVADTGNDKVRRIDASGTIRTVAGGSEDEFVAGDGGLATAAALFDPRGVAVAPDGSLYIADTWNHRVRRVDPEGIITTIAGTGEDDTSGDGGPAIEASLSHPLGVVVGRDGSVYVDDAACVRRIAPDGTITTVAGTGEPGFAGDGGPATEAMVELPCALALAPDGSLYIADREAGRIRCVDLGGVITTVADLEDPTSVAVAPDGLLVIADPMNERIVRAELDGTVTVVAGSKPQPFPPEGIPATEAGLELTNVAVDTDGTLLLTQGNSICRVDRDGMLTRIAGVEGACFVGLAAGRDGRLYASDNEGGRVFRVEPNRPPAVICGTGELGADGDDCAALEAQLIGPQGVAVGPDGSIYVADTENLGAEDGTIMSHRVRRVDPNGNIRTLAGAGDSGYFGDGGPATLALVSDPYGLAVAGDGTVYFSDSGNNRVRCVTPDGIITTVAGNGEDGFGGDGGPAIDAQLDHPKGITLGPDGTLFVADWFNYRIRRVDPNGVITTIAGTGEQSSSGDGGPATRATLEPGTLALAPNGDLYVTDGERVRRITRACEPASSGAAAAESTSGSPSSGSR